MGKRFTEEQTDCIVKNNVADVVSIMTGIPVTRSCITRNGKSCL